MSDLGKHFGGLFYKAEIDYLAANEWAQTAENVLWRRTKKGLQLDKEQAASVAQYLSDQYGFKQEG